MTPALWFVFAVVGIGSALLIALAIATAPRNKDIDK